MRNLLLMLSACLGLALLWLVSLNVPWKALPPEIQNSPGPASRPAMTTSAVPETLLQEVVQDLATTANIPAAQIKLRSAQPQTWPDGCLGLAKADEFCTQVLVAGWRLVLEQGSKTWVYRTDLTGGNRRLEPSSPGE